MRIAAVRTPFVATLVLVCLSGRLCFGQSTQPTEPPKPADEAISQEAKEAYKVGKQALLDLDYKALARTLADNRRPLLPKDQQTDASVAETAEKLKSNEQDLKKTQQLLSDAEALKPEFGPATMQETTVRNMKVTLVKVPLLGTRDLAEKHGMGKGRWTADDEGNLAVLMVKHDGSWYWNPFGW